VNIGQDFVALYDAFFGIVIVSIRKGVKMNTIEIKKMSTIERLQAMEALWDSLMDEESEIESPQWHRDILEERKRKIENGKAEFISLEELKATRNL
jgi:putative addiction module component (TIGR02574 family)